MTLSTFKKLSLLFLTANLFTLALSAQIQWGLKGGLNSTEINTSDNQNVIVGGNPQKMRNFPRTEFNAGLLFSIPMNKKFTFQPEAVFSAQGATGKPTVQYLVSATEAYKFDFINIPLLLKYNLPMGFFVESGPQLGLLISAKIDETVVGGYTTNNYNVKSQFKSTDISWVFGAGYLSPIDLGFDVRYNLGLTDYSNVSTSGMQAAPVQSGSIRNSVVQIGIFYLFGKGRVRPVKKEGE